MARPTKATPKSSSAVSSAKRTATRAKAAEPEPVPSYYAVMDEIMLGALKAVLDYVNKANDKHLRALLDDVADDDILTFDIKDFLKAAGASSPAKSTSARNKKEIPDDERCQGSTGKNGENQCKLRGNYEFDDEEFGNGELYCANHLKVAELEARKAAEGGDGSRRSAGRSSPPKSTRSKAAASSNTRSKAAAKRKAEDAEDDGDASEPEVIEKKATKNTTPTSKGKKVVEPEPEPEDDGEGNITQIELFKGSKYAYIEVDDARVVLDKEEKVIGELADDFDLKSLKKSDKNVLGAVVALSSKTHKKLLEDFPDLVIDDDALPEADDGKKADKGKKGRAMVVADPDEE